MDESAFTEKPIKPPKPDKSKYNMRQRSISESKMVEESTPIKKACNNSLSNLENRDPSGHDNKVRPTTEMMQKRRSSSADGRKWLAHTPNETVHTNTVLQPAISANKRVHIPSVSDLKRTDDYLLTHQEQGDQNQLKTTLVKGEIFDTRTGGVQVKFTGKERLTTVGLDDNRRRK